MFIFTTAYQLTVSFLSFDFWRIAYMAEDKNGGGGSSGSGSGGGAQTAEEKRALEEIGKLQATFEEKSLNLIHILMPQKVRSLEALSLKYKAVTHQVRTPGSGGAATPTVGAAAATTTPSSGSGGGAAAVAAGGSSSLITPIESAICAPNAAILALMGAVKSMNLCSAPFHVRSLYVHLLTCCYPVCCVVVLLCCLLYANKQLTKQVK